MNNNRYKSSLTISWISILVNLFVAALKFIVGFLSNSIAILTDAAHSLEDLLTTVVVIVSLYGSRKPPDEGHPFGHGRVEYVGGLILSFLLILMGLAFLKNSIVRFFNPQSVNINIIFMAAVLFTAIVKLILGVATNRVSQKVSSQILKTDALHHYSDCITSLAVVIGLIFVKLGFLYVDCVVGGIISLVIIFWALKMGREFIDSLIGKRAPDFVYEKVKAIALSFVSVEGVHDIEVHSYGENRVISLHIEMDPALSLEEAHGIADSIEKKAAQEDLGKCIVHVDLKEKEKTRSKDRVEKLISQLVAIDSKIKDFHNVEIISAGRRSILNFHLLLDKQVPLDDLHKLCHGLSRIIKKELGFWKVNIHFEPYERR